MSRRYGMHQGVESSSWSEGKPRPTTTQFPSLSRQSLRRLLKLSRMDHVVNAHLPELVVSTRRCPLSFSRRCDVGSLCKLSTCYLALFCRNGGSTFPPIVILNTRKHL